MNRSMNLIVATALVFLTGLIVVGLNAETSNINENCQRCGANLKDCSLPVVGNDGQTRYKVQCCKPYQECAKSQRSDENHPSPYCENPECKWSYGLRRHNSEKYNPETQCCTKDGPKNRYPIQAIYECADTLTARKGVKPEPN